MNDYSLAVIIPNYNKEKYLKRCIQSILDQTIQPDEIIVVDDLSTDHSLKILDDLKRTVNNLKVVELKENGGVSNARNKGVEKARSSYIKFIDADDFFYEKNAFEQEMKLIKQYKEKGKEILAYSSLVFANNDGSISKKLDYTKSYHYLEGKATYKLLARIQFISIANNFTISKETFIQSGGFNYPKNLYEDYEVLIRLSMLVDFYHAPAYGRAYRYTEDGLSKRPREEHDIELKKIFRMYYSQLNALEKAKVQMFIILRKLRQIR